MLKDLVTKNRTYRRFYENEKVDKNILLELIELARLSSCAANKQSLRYFISTGDKNSEILNCLAWAGYLKEWDGPELGERPSAYIVVLNDKSIYAKPEVDAGIACQSILLGATEKGLGGCIFGSVNRTQLSQELSLPENLDILLVIAIGRPKEIVVLEPLAENGDIQYWRDDALVHHVPKRSLNDIVINI